MSDERDIAPLVARAQRADAEAVGALYDHYLDRVFRFVRFRLGSRLDAEDVTQRVFLHMIEALPRYRVRGTPFGAWLFRIARNAVIDHQRTHRAHDALEAVADAASGEPSPEDRAIISTEMQRVAGVLEELTEDQREVISLRYWAGLSHAEIAALLGRREGAIRAIQFRALQALRQRLDESPRTAAVRAPEVSN